MDVFFSRAVKRLLAALLVAVVVGLIYEQIGERRDRQLLPQIGRSVDIGGRSLNIFCSGEGRPAVIFDSGNNSPGYAWSNIQPEVAKLTRACWFDRAGYGWSDPGPFPTTSAASSTDLHELLHRAAIPAPYMFVGHSLGGLNARVYNGKYPTDLAGMVLVDAAHEDEPRRAPPAMLGRTVSRIWWHPIWIAGQAARRVGLLRLMRPRVTLPADPAARTREEIVQALRLQPKTIATQFDPSAPDSYAEAERAGGFGDRPLIVLTRGRVSMPPNPSEVDRQLAAYEQVWQHEIQPKLAGLSTRGRQVIVAQSGHDIPDEAPEAVLTAVREVLADVRGNQPQTGSGGATKH
jgi:pimeloyl-ACP methyl ester carboxylesterase